MWPTFTGSATPKISPPIYGERNTPWLHSTILQMGDTAWTFLTLYLETNNKRFNVLPFRSRITSLLIPSKTWLVDSNFRPSLDDLFHQHSPSHPIRHKNLSKQNGATIDLVCLFTMVGYSEASQLASRLHFDLHTLFIRFLLSVFC